MKINKYYIIFDVFGVLITRGFESSSKILSHLLKKDINEIKPIYERWEIPFDLGLLSEKQFWELVQRDLGTHVYWKLLNNAVLNNYSLKEDTMKLMRTCSKFTDVYLLSNTRKEWFEYLDKKFSITKYIKRAFLSYNIKLLKPDLDCYLYVTKAIGCKPYQIIFIDDNLENVQAALSVGWRAHKFVDVKSAKDFLLNYINFNHN